MGSDKPSNEENRSVSTSPLQMNEEFTFTVKKNEAADSGTIFKSSRSSGADPVSFPCMPLPVALQGHMHGTYQPHTHDIHTSKSGLIADVTRLGNLQNPQTDLSSTIRSNIYGFLGVPQFSHPEENINRKHQSINYDNMMIADNAVKGYSYFGGFHYPQIERNFMPMRGGVTDVCQLSGWGGESKAGIINNQQNTGSFITSGNSMPMLYLAQNTQKMETGADVSVLPVQFCSQEKIDGNFLTLGIGGKVEASNKLEESVSSPFGAFHTQQNNRNSSSMDNNLAGDLSSLAYNMGGWTSSYNDIGVLHGSKSGLNSGPYNSIQTPDASVPYNVFVTNNRNSGFVSQRDAKLADLHPYKGSLGKESPSPLSKLAPKCDVPSCAQPSCKEQQCLMKTAGNFSPESFNTPLLGQRGIYMQQDHSGQLVPASNGNVTHAAGSQRIDVQSVGQLLPANKASTPQDSHFPWLMGVQVTEGARAPTVGPFPKRLGVQLHEGNSAQAAKGGPFVGRASIQTDGNQYLAQGGGPIQFPNNFMGPSLTIGNQHLIQGSEPIQFHNNLPGPSFTIGRCYDSIPAQVSTNPPKSSSNTGQQPRDIMPVQFSRDLLRPASTSGIKVPDPKVNGLSQASNMSGQPPLKRGAIRPPATTSWVQRRKIMPQPTAHPYKPYPKQSGLPPIPQPSRAPSSASASLHIKWQGFDGPPQPTGEKCLLCKRDLSYAREGPIHQPTVPPAVAVLPCGHTFHDHCLQLITPEGQSKDPPCIPCAIGET